MGPRFSAGLLLVCLHAQLLISSPAGAGLLGGRQGSGTPLSLVSVFTEPRGASGCRGPAAPDFSSEGGRSFAASARLRRCSPPGLRCLRLRGGKNKRFRGIRQLHNYVPKHKRAGENPVQVNKPHRMRKKEKDRSKAEKRLSNVLTSVRMEDRERLYDAGAIDAPHFSDKFRTRASRLEAGEASELSDMGDAPTGVVSAWSGAGAGAGGAAAAADAARLGGDDDEGARMDDGPSLALPGQHTVAAAAGSASGGAALAKGDAVEYRDAGGRWVRGEVVAVDRGILPPSVSVQLPGGHVRETVVERLRLLPRAAPPAHPLAALRGPRGADAGTVPPREQVAAARAVDPAAQFYDRRRGEVLHPALRAAMGLPRLMAPPAAGASPAPPPPPGLAARSSGDIMGSLLGQTQTLRAAEREEEAAEAHAAERARRGKLSREELARLASPRVGGAGVRKDHRFRRYGR